MQPTLSNRIACLEGTLGIRLFDREHGRPCPTEIAVLIANRAEIIGRDAALPANDIVRLASGQAGVVRIGMQPAPGRVLLSPIVERVATQLPQVALEIVYGSTRALANQLQARDPDNVIVAHPEHPVFRRQVAGIGAILRSFPLAIPFLEQRYIDMAKEFFDVDVGQLPERIVCSDFEFLVRLVARGPRYFTAGPVFAFAPEIEAGRLRVLDTPGPFDYQVALHTNTDAFPIPAVAGVMDIIRKVFGDVLLRSAGN